MLRTICSVVSVRSRLKRDRPLASPNAKPIEPPMTKPESARSVLMPMFSTSSPEARRRTKAASTAEGGAITLSEIRPAREAASQARIRAAGSSQPARLRATVFGAVLTMA
jgi:hypothetical protein